MSPDKRLLALFFLLKICHSIGAESDDIDPYCKLVKNGVKLGSVDNCQTYYECQNGKAIQGTCPSSQSFDKNVGYCRPSSDVDCYFGNKEPCKALSKTDGFVPVVGSCNEYIWCKNSREVGRGTCPGNLIFNKGECIYGECQAEKKDGLNSICEIMPDNKFFGSSRDCQVWNKCENTKLIVGNCPDGYVYDVQLESCNYKSANVCSRVTGQEVIPDPTPARPCNAEQKGNIDPDVSVCSVYYVCDGTKWVRSNCPNGMFFSTRSKKCELRQMATPTNNCNRCEFSKKLFVNAVDPACNNYLICSNGQQKSAGSCGSDHYFDEPSQACIEIGSTNRSAYALKNGACFSCDDTCSRLDNSQCQPKLSCNCALKDNACVHCTSETCSSESTTTAVP